MLRILGLTALALAVTVAVACGGDDDASGTTTPSSGTPGSTVAARDVTDEEYLAVICAGLDKFWYALNNARSVEEIRTVVVDYRASLEQVRPAPDVRAFHEQLLAYLDDSVEEPTSLATSPRPLPADSVRARLAEKESSVPECKSLTFFAVRPEDKSTP